MFSFDGSLMFNGTFELMCSWVRYTFGGLSDFAGVGGFSAFDSYLGLRCFGLACEPFELSYDTPRLKASKLVYLEAVSPRDFCKNDQNVTYIELLDMHG